MFTFMCYFLASWLVFLYIGARQSANAGQTGYKHDSYDDDHLLR